MSISSVIVSRGEIKDEIVSKSSTLGDSLVCSYESLSKGDKFLVYITFITNGISTMLAWNAVVNSFVALRFFIWPGQVFSNLLGGFEYSAAFLTCLAMYWFNGLNVSFLYASGLLNLLVTILFPTITYVYAGIDNLATGKVLLTLLSVVAGVGSGLFNVVGFSYASIMPFKNSIPLVSGGHGMAGVVSLTSYILLSEIIFSQELQQQKIMLWAFFSIGTLIIMIHLTAFTILNRRSWFRQIVNTAILQAESTSCLEACKATFTKHPKVEHHDTRDECSDSKESFKAPTYEQASTGNTEGISTFGNTGTHVGTADDQWPPPRHIKLIFYDCGIYVFSGFITVVMTLFVFPLTGPYNWGQEPTMTTILNGVFQVTNMVMRYSPAWGLRLPKKMILPAAISRVVFIPLFLIPSRIIPDDPIARHAFFLTLLMLVFSITHGAMLTLTSMAAVASLKNPKEKVIIGKLLTICFSFSCIIGMFSSRLLVM